MICPGVQANSVRACNAGNVKRLFESRAGLESVPCLAPWNIPWNICSGVNGRQLVFHAMSVEHAYSLGFTAHDSCSHLFTEQTSGQDSRNMSRILPEAEVSHLYHASSHGERCETSCFALRVLVSFLK
jgi:hypothetical protein